MQIKCLAESICSMILCDSFALQCGFLHFRTVSLLSACRQHGSASLITNATSWIGLDAIKFLQAAVNRLTASAAPKTRATMDTPPKILAGLNLIIFWSENKKPANNCKENCHKENSIAQIFNKHFTALPVWEPIKINAWNGRSSATVPVYTVISLIVFCLRCIAENFQCCHRCAPLPHMQTLIFRRW